MIYKNNGISYNYPWKTNEPGKCHESELIPGYPEAENGTKET